MGNYPGIFQRSADVNSFIVLQYRNTYMWLAMQYIWMQELGAGWLCGAARRSKPWCYVASLADTVIQQSVHVSVKPT